MPQADMNDWTGGHPDEGLLHEWLDEQLPAQVASEIDAHVAACSACSARVAEARGLIAASHRILAALDDVPAGVIPAAPVAIPNPHAGDNRWRRWGQIAAVLVVAVAGGSYLFRGGAVTERLSNARDSSVDSSVAVQSQAAAPSAESAVGAAVPAPVAVASKRVAQDREAPKAEAERRVAANGQPSRAERTPARMAPRARASASVADTAALQRAPMPTPTTPMASPVAPMVSALPAPPPPSAPAGAVPSARATGVGAGTAADQVATNGRGAGGMAGARGGTGDRPAQRADTLRAGNLHNVTVTSGAVGASDSSALLRAPSRLLLRSATSESRALFDSVTLIRRVCAASCETTALHVTAAGVVRYTIGTGNTQRVEMSQLSASEGTQLYSLLLLTLGNAVLGAGTTSCSTGGSPGGTALEVIVARPANVPARDSASCAATRAQLMEFGAAVDALVRVDVLRGRGRPGGG